MLCDGLPDIRTRDDGDWRSCIRVVKFESPPPVDPPVDPPARVSTIFATLIIRYYRKYPQRRPDPAFRCPILNVLA